MVKKKSRQGLIIPAYTKCFPSQEEITCGLILTQYFNSSIKCIPSDNASAKSPDFLVTRLNQVWELKTIRGNSDNTIHHAFERSNGQSENLIINLRKSKMHPKSAIGRIKRELKCGIQKKRILIITKNNGVVAIKQ